MGPGTNQIMAANDQGILILDAMRQTAALLAYHCPSSVMINTESIPLYAGGLTARSLRPSSVSCPIVRSLSRASRLVMKAAQRLHLPQASSNNTVD